jgi:hypothetical protein
MPPRWGWEIIWEIARYKHVAPLALGARHSCRFNVTTPGAHENPQANGRLHVDAG